MTFANMKSVCTLWNFVKKNNVGKYLVRNAQTSGLEGVVQTTPGRTVELEHFLVLYKG
jgi:hypothetical protein